MSRFEDKENRSGGRTSNRQESGFRSGGRSGGNSRFGGGQGNRSGGSRFGGNRSGSSRFGSQRRFNDGPREMHKAVCSECKQECEVPFKPTEGKPVYCNDCFKKHKRF